MLVGGEREVTGERSGFNHCHFCCCYFLLASSFEYMINQHSAGEGDRRVGTRGKHHTMGEEHQTESPAICFCNSQFLENVVDFDFEFLSKVEMHQR